MQTFYSQHVTIITLGAHAQQGYGGWVCVCLSVTQYLTSPMFVRLTNNTIIILLTGNEGHKFQAVFSEIACPVFIRHVFLRRELAFWFFSIVPV